MRRTAATGTLRGDLTVALDGLGGCLSRLRLEGRSTGVGWRSGARNGSQVAMGGPQEPSDRSGRLTADGVISDAGLAASPARTAPHTSEGGHGYVSLLDPAARRAGVDLSTPRSTLFAHFCPRQDRLSLAAARRTLGASHGDVTAALDEHGGCPLRLWLESRSAGVR